MGRGSSPRSGARRRRRITLPKDGRSEESSSSWPESWAKDGKGWWFDDQGTDGDSQSFRELWDSRHPKRPNPKRQGSELGRQTKILHDAGALIEEIQATWHKNSKGSHKKKRRTHAYTDRSSQEHVRAATEARVELKELQSINTEAEVIMAAKRLQEYLRQCFKREAAALDVTE